MKGRDIIKFLDIYKKTIAVAIGIVSAAVYFINYFIKHLL